MNAIKTGKFAAIETCNGPVTAAARHSHTQLAKRLVPPVSSLIRILQRVAVLGLGVLSVWLIVFVFKWVDFRLPWILALSVTYGLAAYVILPRAVRMGLKILQRRHVPRFTITADGLPGDPVNLALIGTIGQLRAAFAFVGWAEADPVGVGKLVAHGPSLSLQQTLPDCAVQHSLPFRAGPRRRLSAGD